MERPFIGLLCGSDDAMEPIWSADTGVWLHGNNDAWRLINHPNRFRMRRLHIAPSYFDHASRWQLQHCDAVLSMISNSDQNPRTLAVADQLVAPVRARVINDPARVLETGRESVARRLSGLPGLIVPRVVRLGPADVAAPDAALAATGVRFPAIARRPGTHSGKILGILDRPERVRQFIGPGQPELLLTEFVDFRSADGLYRKLRFFVIGDQVIFRHLLVAAHWNLHARDRRGIMLERPELRREERAIQDGAHGVLPGAAALLREIRRRLGIDYFGMDCALAPDGRFILFEANATMNFFPFSEDPRYDYVRGCEAPAVEAMTDLLRMRARMTEVTETSLSLPIG